MANTVAESKSYEFTEDLWNNIENVKKCSRFTNILCRGTSNLPSVTCFLLHHVHDILFFPCQNVTTDDHPSCGG